MTSPTRSEIAKAFRRAAQALEAGRKSFICHALELQGTPAAEAARKIVLERLHPFDAYGNWLEAHHRDIYLNRYRQQFLSNMIPPRLFWLSALIEEFSK